MVYTGHGGGRGKGAGLTWLVVVVVNPPPPLLTRRCCWYPAAAFVIPPPPSLSCRRLRYPASAVVNLLALLLIRWCCRRSAGAFVIPPALCHPHPCLRCVVHAFVPVVSSAVSDSGCLTRRVPGF